MKKPLSPAAIATIIVVVIAAILVGSAGFYTDFLWFKQLGYSNVFTTQLWANVGIFALSFVVMGVSSWAALYIAFRNRPVYAQYVASDRPGMGAYRDLLTQIRKLVMVVAPIALALFAGVASIGTWKTVLMFLNKTSAGVVEPQFHLDVSFYMFDLPFYNLIDGFLSGVTFIALLLGLAVNLVFGAIRFSGRTVTFSKAARVQTAVSAALFVAFEAFSLWLQQFQTMTSASGLYTGATYSDVNARIPALQILAGIGILVAALFLVAAFIGKWRLPVMATGLMLVTSLLLGGLYPWIVQTFQVVPNERTLESEFIKRNIEATRFAYGLDNVESVNYNAKTTATEGALRADAQTTAQIRIIDPALVSSSFRQLEQYRQYYNFSNHLDVDRYNLNGKSQDTVIAVRELNQSGLGSSQSWINNVIVYTHGYGVVAAYGNQRSVDGQPVFLQSGIPSTGALGKYNAKIYFGEASPSYSIVGGPKGSKPLEMDYPAGKGASQQTYTTFTGNGGPKLDNVVSRLAYAIKFRSEQILLSNSVTNQSQILYNRNPMSRVKAVAPYLTIDSDSYPAIVNGRVVWIVDGYTTSKNYPYSRAENPNQAIDDSSGVKGKFSGNINYIRNSVKATVDAYDGSVKLYAWDTKDPILKTWQKIFPSSLLPISKMSGALLSHVRYPSDLFKVQRNMLGAYHVTEAGAFYSQQDAWMVPNDPVGSSVVGAGTAQPPYYLTMQTPLQKSPAFSLYTTFIPRSTGESSRNVLTGYLVADSDAGSKNGVKASSYGKLQLLVLPRETVVPGPGQVQNNFNADSDVSKLLNLLRQGSTKVLNGNLLTLPVGGGLLYVQPVYIQSTGETSFPLLKKVLVAFGDKIAFEDTLDGALNTLFGGQSGATAGDGSGTGAGTGTGTGTGTGSGTGTGGTNNALQIALNAAKQALADKAAALTAGDWTAYGKADAALSKAIEAALKASGAK
jgi:uncharacterized membrane protein (UPF0182 family)